MTPVEFAARPQKGRPRSQFGAEPPEEWRGGGVRCAEPAVPRDAISLTRYQSEKLTKSFNDWMHRMTS